MNSFWDEIDKNVCLRMMLGCVRIPLENDIVNDIKLEVQVRCIFYVNFSEFFMKAYAVIPCQNCIDKGVSRGVTV